MTLWVHLGTPWPNRRSIFLSLEAYCREANKEGWKLKFPEVEEHLDFSDGSIRSGRSEDDGEELPAEKNLERVRMQALLERIRTNFKTSGGQGGLIE